MLARWSQEDGDFKPSLNNMRHCVINKNKNAPKQNLKIVYYMFITMLSSPKEYGTDRKIRHLSWEQNEVEKRMST